MREVELPSGAMLGVTPAPFALSKALHQAFLREIKAISVSKDTDVREVIKNIACVGFSSPEVDLALAECMKRCSYNQRRIDQDTFESPQARGDYVSACIEVATENLKPFLKSLYAAFCQFSGLIEGFQA